MSCKDAKAVEELKNRKWYIVCLHTIFCENALCLAQRLNIKIVECFKPNQNDKVFIFGSHNKAPELCAVIKEKELKAIIFQSENITSQHFDNKYYIELLKMPSVLVYDWSPYHITKLKELDVRVCGLFTFEFSSLHADNTDRPVDFFFTGMRNPDRVRFFEDLRKKYPKALIVADFDYSFTEMKRLNEVMRRSKYVLNLPYHDNCVLATHRINKALAIGCGVISPFTYDEELDQRYKPFVHFGNPIKVCDKIMSGATMPVKKKWKDFMETGGYALIKNLNDLADQL